eukprot:2643556-Ditylum_brightwellii.AAC.1
MKVKGKGTHDQCHLALQLFFSIGNMPIFGWVLMWKLLLNIVTTIYYCQDAELFHNDIYEHSFDLLPFILQMMEAYTV